MDRIKELKRGFRRNQGAIAAMLAAYQQTQATVAAQTNLQLKNASHAGLNHSNEQSNK